ncbi:TPA: hypothetical protein MM158_005141 [Klebsiella pneumoniae]|nr:hypothetical protein [Klebsiella pneumoniae]
MTMIFRFLIATALYGFAAYVIKATLPEYFSPYVWGACFVLIFAAIVFMSAREK